MLKVFVSFSSDEEMDYIKNGFENYDVTFENDNIENCDVIFGNISPELLKKCDKLKWLQTVSAGISNELINELPQNVLLTNASGAYDLAISEYMIATHLMLFKKLHQYRDNMKENKWRDRGEIKSIKDSVVVVLGCGNIGSGYAKLVKAMGAYVIGIKRTISNKPDFLDELYTIEDLEKVLPRADMLAISLPGTKKTEKMINKETLSIMKKGASIMNVGRGNIIDTDDLCDFLESGHIFSAALDVTDPEPLPSNHRLWSMENVVITPHVSGGFSLAQTKLSIIEIFRENLKLYLEKKELKNLVNLKEGY